MDRKNNKGKLLKKMRQDAEILLAQVKEMEALVAEEAMENRLSKLFKSDVYNRFLSFTEENYHCNPPSNSEWSALAKLFRAAFPRYYKLVSVDNKLTSDQLRVCMLLRLSIPHYVMARIMDVDIKRVSRLKAQINYRLFNERCVKTLEDNLKPYY